MGKLVKEINGLKINQIENAIENAFVITDLEGEIKCKTNTLLEAIKWANRNGVKKSSI